MLPRANDVLHRENAGFYPPGAVLSEVDCGLRGGLGRLLRPGATLAMDDRSREPQRDQDTKRCDLIIIPN